MASRTLAHRLYLILFRAALAFAFALPAYVLVVRVHDTVVLGWDVECHERELSGSPVASGKCQVDAAGGDPGFWVSRNGWDEHRLVDLRPGDTVLLVLGFMVFSGIPLVAVMALRASYRWMARRTKEKS